MVVVVIIGLLAAVIVPQVVDKVDEARVAKAKQDIKSHRDRAHHVPPRQLEVPDHRPGPPRARPAAHRPLASATGARAATSSASARTRGATTTSTSIPARMAANTTSSRSARTTSRAAKARRRHRQLECRGIAPRARAGDAAGFTLIELLVVVVIIGDRRGHASCSRSASPAATASSRRKASAPSRSSTTRASKAELQTREFGLFCDDNGYEFLTFDAAQGTSGAASRKTSRCALRELPAGLMLRLVVEGRAGRAEAPSQDQTREDKKEQGKARQERIPHVMIFSNGDLTPFELTRRARGRRAQRHHGEQRSGQDRRAAACKERQAMKHAHARLHADRSAGGARHRHASAWRR